MGYFDDRGNVDEYISMADGYDGRELIDVLKMHLAPDSTVLELGMGPGKDLDLLAKSYTVTGSDSSQIFLALYREHHPKADLMALDAVSIETERIFDCIYSNKVLHHLSKADINRSFISQRVRLPIGGISMHSFWFGDDEEEYQGLRFVYYTEDELLNIIGPGFEVVALERYTELENDDSLYILLRKI